MRLAWLPVVLWIGLISYLSTDSFSGPSSGALLRFWATFLHLPVGPQGLQLANLVLRKSAHTSEFFVLGFLLYRALSPDYKTVWEVVERVLLIGGACALFDELHQAFTATRGPSLLDVGWDFAGVLSSQLWIWRRNVGTKQRQLLPSSES